MKGPVLIVAPHPDDEVLGAGGTIARLASEGIGVDVVIVTRGFPPHFPNSAVERTRAEARAAHAALGVRRTWFLDFPAAGLDTVPHRELNAGLGEVFQEITPCTVLLPFGGDLHMDHQVVFLSGLVASRPTNAAYPAEIYAYETLSETNWNAPYVTPGFIPNTFVDISGFLSVKLEAMALFTSQVKAAPHERSIDALRALATFRGGTVGRSAAEAFVLLRRIL